MIVLWFCRATRAARRRHRPAIQYSFAGRLARCSNTCSHRSVQWQISIALVPGLAAREVAVGASAPCMRWSAAGDDVAGQLEPVIAAPGAWRQRAHCSPGTSSHRNAYRPSRWSSAKTNSWRYPIIMAVPICSRCYIASFVT
jgi:ferrous iron transport protein B